MFNFFFFINWTSRGVNSSVTQFHTQFSLCFFIFWANNRKQKKVWEKNCFYNVVLDLFQNCLMCLTNVITFFCKLILQQFYQKSETIYLKQFFLNYFVFLFCKAKKCLETCMNCVWNCVMPLLNPLEVKFSKKKVKNIFLPYMNSETCSKGDIRKIYQYLRS